MIWGMGEVMSIVDVQPDFTLDELRQGGLLIQKRVFVRQDHNLDPALRGGAQSLGDVRRGEPVGPNVDRLLGGVEGGDRRLCAATAGRKPNMQITSDRVSSIVFDFRRPQATSGKTERKTDDQAD